MNFKILIVTAGLTAGLALAPQAQAAQALRYLPIGDSYTIGQSLPVEKNFPTQLTRALILKGVKVQLLANPARTGWTTQDALKKELPIFQKAKPNFSTLLIGVNDWVQGVDAESFRTRLRTLMDAMIKVLGSPRRLIVLTIPDFSVTPAGKAYEGTKDVQAGLAVFNAIIKEEAEFRHLQVLDLFEVTREMKADSEFLAPDGLHPSPKEYEHWVALLLPKMEALVGPLPGSHRPFRP
jgi:lysophospholipase L1-like esterase